MSLAGGSKSYHENLAPQAFLFTEVNISELRAGAEKRNKGHNGSGGRRIGWSTIGYDTAGSGTATISGGTKPGTRNRGAPPLVSRQRLSIEILLVLYPGKSYRSSQRTSYIARS